MVASASFAAARVTVCGTLQFAGVNARLAPLCTVRSASPDWNAVATVVLAAGAAPRLTAKFAEPLSGTVSEVRLTTSVCAPSLSLSAIIAVAEAFVPIV